MVTKAEVINWARSLADAGRGHDADGYYGSQCVDLPNGASKIFFNKSLMGNGIDMLNSARAAGYRVETTGSPRAGAFFCMRTNAHPYGHTGLVIEDANGSQVLKTIEQNVDGGAVAVGGPARYVNRAMSSGAGAIIGWFYLPYSDIDAIYGQNQNKVGYQAKSITYSGHTISAENVNKLLRHFANRQLLPSAAITQLYLESYFGDSPVGRADNNWSGMSGTAQTRPSGVIVTTGSPRAEGGTYFHYSNVDDFFNDWTYLLANSGIYKVAGKKTIEEFTLGLFQKGGAKYNYAEAGYERYLPSMQSIARGINSHPGQQGILDEMDNAFKNGNLIVSGLGTEGQERENEDMNFIFSVVNDPAWNAGVQYFYNSYVNTILEIHNSDELKFLKIIHKETTGRDLKEYKWDSKIAPVQLRIFGVLQPGSPNASVKALIEKLIQQINSEI